MVAVLSLLLQEFWCVLLELFLVLGLAFFFDPRALQRQELLDYFLYQINMLVNASLIAQQELPQLLKELKRLILKQ